MHVYRWTQSTSDPKLSSFNPRHVRAPRFILVLPSRMGPAMRYRLSSSPDTGRTEVTVCGGVRVTNPNDVSHASWQYTVEFIQSGNVRTRVVYPSEIDLPTGLAAAKGAMPAGTKLVLQSGWLVLKTQSTADSPAPRHLSGTPARS